MLGECRPANQYIIEPARWRCCSSFTDSCSLLCHRVQRAFAPEAIREEQLHALNLLIASGCNLNAQDQSTGYTAVTLAVGFREAQALDILLQAGASPEITNPILHADSLTQKQARLTGKRIVVKLTPLALAASIGDEMIMLKLLAAGADLRTREPYFGSSAAEWAAHCGQERALKLLVKDAWTSAGNNLVLDQPLDQGASALHVFASSGQLSAVMMLLDAGANPLLTDARGLTAYDYAQQHGENDIAHILKTVTLWRIAELNKSTTTAETSPATSSSLSPIGLLLIGAALLLPVAYYLSVATRLNRLSATLPGTQTSPATSSSPLSSTVASLACVTAASLPCPVVASDGWTAQRSPRRVPSIRPPMTPPILDLTDASKLGTSGDGIGTKSLTPKSFAALREVNQLNAARMRLEEKKKPPTVEPPIEFICPLTLDVMINPVRTATGHVYEHDEIKRWLRTNTRDPITNLELPTRRVTADELLRAAIEAWTVSSKQ